jgi:putative drug exporter of the RND superfamily
VGTTIGLGLLFDTLIVRTFMTPSVAVLLGRWFWWPLRVPGTRPVRYSGPLDPVPGSFPAAAMSGDSPVTDRLPRIRF